METPNLPAIRALRPAWNKEEPERFSPEIHVAYEEKLSWLNIEDSLRTKTGPRVTDA